MKTNWLSPWIDPSDPSLTFRKSKSDPDEPWFDLSDYDEETIEIKCECGIWKLYGKTAPTQMHSEWCKVRSLQ